MATIKMKWVSDSGIETICTVDTSQKIEKNFTVNEIGNPSAKDDIKYISTPRHRKFMKMIQEVRNKFGSMTVNSGFRTVAFNKSCGGDAKSRHLYGEALDWGVGKAKMTDAFFNQVKAFWESLCIKYGEYGAINRYTNGIHLEIGSDLSYGSTTFQVRNYVGKKGDW